MRLSLAAGTSNGAQRADLMIRPAELSDRFAMVRMTRDFFEASGLVLPFDAAWVEASIKAWISDEEKLALVLDLEGVRGMLCAAHVMSPLAPVRVSTEQAFWIDPCARGRWALAMLRTYEEWAKAQGCAVAGLASMGGRGADVIYRRRGFVPSETYYMKEI